MYTGIAFPFLFKQYKKQTNIIKMLVIANGSTDTQRLHLQVNSDKHTFSQQLDFRTWLCEHGSSQTTYTQVNRLSGCQVIIKVDYMQTKDYVMFLTKIIKVDGFRQSRLVLILNKITTMNTESYMVFKYLETQFSTMSLYS